MQWITDAEVDHPRPAKFPNGAIIYGNEVARTQRPGWDALYGDDHAICLTLPMPKIKQPLKPYRRLIHYLHRYPYARPLGDVSVARSWAKAPVVFIVAYRAFQELLEGHGIPAVYIPMGITRFPMAPTNEIRDRFVWFGNIYSEKREMHARLAATLKSHGIGMDTVSQGKFNGEPVSREEALAIVGRYRYGIGVGKCAQEMYAMGLKVLIAGQAVGGLAMTDQDEEAQLATNYNGRVVTFSDSLSACIEAIDSSRVCSPNWLEDADHAGIFAASPHA